MPTTWLNPLESRVMGTAKEADISPERPSLVKSFTRSQLSSVLATGLDFCVMTLMVEVLAIWSVTATAVGAFVGAVTHFICGRYWSFLASEGGLKSQAMRYALVAFAGLLLNALGVLLMTEYLDMHYFTSRIIISLVVGVFFNFPLHRHFVFKY